jgi:hypothetical protein
MSPQIIPPDWVFPQRDKAAAIQVGDRLRVELVDLAIPAGACGNCGGLEQVFSRLVRSSGPVTYVEGRRIHAELQGAPCPVCQGDALARWLTENCGLAGLHLDDKPALDVRVADQRPSLGQEAAFKYAWALLAELPDPHTWALFTGDYGRGKTHVLAGLVNGCRLAGTWALYTSTEAILERLRRTYDPQASAESTEDVRRRFEDVPVLVVDELDRVKWTDWAGEKLVAILNARYLQRRATWFASNLGPKALAAKVEPLAALVSRISSGYVVVLEGPDLRPAFQPELPELPAYLTE